MTNKHTTRSDPFLPRSNASSMLRSLMGRGKTAWQVKGNLEEREIFVVTDANLVRVSDYFMSKTQNEPPVWCHLCHWQTCREVDIEILIIQMIICPYYRSLVNNDSNSDEVFECILVHFIANLSSCIHPGTLTWIPKKLPYLKGDTWFFLVSVC